VSHFSGVQDYNQTNLQLVLKNPNFNPAKPTVLYFNGLTQSADDFYVIWMRDAYVNAGYNFILFQQNVWYYIYEVSCDFKFKNLRSSGLLKNSV
jgi:hypothetical protein